PYVAKVFDAGQTVSGRPYFVMELVDGVPLLEFCDRNRLSIRERVELFILVCQAIQHAHQKGVVHRDLKPSNILVSSNDGRPIPKIIDFGIAKAVDIDSAERVTAYTRGDQALGTPAYMSPEQAGLGGIDVDTRTDVYSLGVILYELLAGCLPEDPAKMSHAEFLSLLAKGAIHPPRPSSRAAGLKGQVRRDLDWIVMKALEVDRTRRYDTTTALAEDLGRYLREEPVVARPPTFSYRAGKFVRRHRLQVAAATIAGIALLGGTIATGLGMLRAIRAETAARQDAATAREVSEFVVRLFEVSDPSEARGKSITARELLDQGASAVESELKQQPEVQANLFGTLSRVHESLGLYRDASLLAEKSLALRRRLGGAEDLQTASILLTLGGALWRLGDMEASRKALEDALAIRIRLLGENHIDVARALNGLAALFRQAHDLKQATSLHERALRIQSRVAGPDHVEVAHTLRGLGAVQNDNRDFDGALASHRRALQIFETAYGDSNPAVADCLDNVALDLENLKKLGEARELLERSLEIRKRTLGPAHPSVAFSYHNLGRVLVGQRNLSAALPLYEEGVRIREVTLGPDSPQTASLIESLAILRIRLGDLAKGIQLLERTLDTYKRAYGEDHTETVETHRNLLVALKMAGRYDEGISHLREVVLRDVDPRFRMDLKDPFFDSMRNRPAFRKLEAEVSQRSSTKK
ncbi:MAG: tetratricopeptide repeat protein, partial [Bryobacteraceae bacterium]